MQLELEPINYEKITELSSYTAEELLKAYTQKMKTQGADRIHSPSDAFSILDEYRDAQVESFFAIYVNGAHQVITVEQISKGTLNRTIVHPREVFKPAIKHSAAGIILAHNHPSGNNDPSQEDIELTKRIKAAGEIIGISILDHVIISASGYYSFLEEGALL